MCANKQLADLHLCTQETAAPQGGFCNAGGDVCKICVAAAPTLDRLANLCATPSELALGAWRDMLATKNQLDVRDE